MAYSVFLLPMGEVDDDVLEEVRHKLHTTFHVDVQILKGREAPSFALSNYRHQFSAPAIIRRIAGLVDHSNAKILGITPYDLFAPRTNFVFGEAQISGPAAVISLYRLIDTDRDKYLARVGKEAVHELGHTFGLDHCDVPTCVMHFSHNISDADKKTDAFCKPDQARIDLALHSLE